MTDYPYLPSIFFVRARVSWSSDDFLLRVLKTLSHVRSSPFCIRSPDLPAELIRMPPLTSLLMQGPVCITLT